MLHYIIEMHFQNLPYYLLQLPVWPIRYLLNIYIHIHMYISERFDEQMLFKHWVKIRENVDKKIKIITSWYKSIIHDAILSQSKINQYLFIKLEDYLYH